jgi:hypothetical protein
MASRPKVLVMRRLRRTESPAGVASVLARGCGVSLAHRPIRI